MVSRRRVLRRAGSAVGVAGLGGVAGCAEFGANDTASVPAHFAAVVPTERGYLARGGFGADEESQSDWFLALDEEFEVLRSWEPTIPEGDPILSVEPYRGGVLVVGRGDAPWVRHYDGAGKRRWTQQFGDLSGITLRAATATEDGFVAVGGDYSNVDHSPNDPDDVDEPTTVIYALDRDGNVEEIGERLGWGELFGVFPDEEGYLVAGWQLLDGTESVRNADRDAVFARYESTGEPTVRHRIDEARYNGGVRSGDRILLRSAHWSGYGFVQDSAPGLRRVDRSGTVHWSAAPDLGVTTGVALREDAGAVAVGHYAKSTTWTPTPSGTERPETGPWAVGYDGDGTQQWMKDPGETIVWANDVVARDDEQFLVAGLHEREDGHSTDGWLAILDGSGTVRESLQYRPPEGAEGTATDS